MLKLVTLKYLHMNVNYHNVNNCVIFTFSYLDFCMAKMALASLVANSGPKTSLVFQGLPIPMPLVMDLARLITINVPLILKVRDVMVF
jgi:hypothetical protein